MAFLLKSLPLRHLRCPICCFTGSAGGIGWGLLVWKQLGRRVSGPDVTGVRRFVILAGHDDSDQAFNRHLH